MPLRAREEDENGLEEQRERRAEIDLFWCCEPVVEADPQVASRRDECCHFVPNRARAGYLCSLTHLSPTIVIAISTKREKRKTSTMRFSEWGASHSPGAKSSYAPST